MIEFLHWLTAGNGLPSWAGYLILFALILAALVVWYRVAYWLGRAARKLETML